MRGLLTRYISLLLKVKASISHKLIFGNCKDVPQLEATLIDVKKK